VKEAAYQVQMWRSFLLMVTCLPFMIIYFTAECNLDCMSCALHYEFPEIYTLKLLGYSGLEQ
jgi:hypothetical protein